MKSISVPVIPQLATTTSSSSDIKYLINYLLYKESNINRWNISAEINVGNYYQVVVTQGKIDNIECLLYSQVD